MRELSHQEIVRHMYADQVRQSTAYTYQQEYEMSYLIYMKDRKGRIYPTVWAEPPRDGTGKPAWPSSTIEKIELSDEDARLSLTILEEKYPCSVKGTELHIQKTSSEASSSTMPIQPIVEEP